MFEAIYIEYINAEEPLYKLQNGSCIKFCGDRIFRECDPIGTLIINGKEYIESEKISDNPYIVFLEEL